MPLELVKEYLEVDQEIRKFNTQTMVEESVIVPDFKPDIDKVLLVTGDIQVNNKVIENNKYFVEGIVDCGILYQTQEEGSKLQNITTEIPFTQSIEVEDEGDIQALLKTNVEYLDYELVNTRKLNIRGVLGLQGKFMKKQQYPLLNDIKGLEDMQMLRNWVKITTIADRAKDQAMVKEQIDLGEMPPIVEIIKSQAKVLEKEIQLSEGQIMVNGTVEVELIYIGEAEEQQSVEYVEYKMPFAHIVEAPNVKEEDEYEYQFNFDVEEILTGIQSNEEGKFTIVDLEVLVAVEGTIYEDHEVESIVDAYSPSIQTHLEKETIHCNEMLSNEKVQSVTKEKINIPMEQEGIDNIISVDGRVKISDAQPQEDQWVVDGVVEVEVLYRTLGEEESYDTLKEEIPFTQSFDLDSTGEITGDAFASIQHIGFQLIGSDEIDLKIILDIQCKLFKPVVFYAIDNIEQLAEVQEEESKDARISVYFKQPEDSLWKIAKRYRITMEEVIGQNDIQDQNSIPNYTPIIIAKNDKYTLK